MIQYKGKTARTVEEALDLFGGDTTVYIGANFDPWIAVAGHHDRIRKVKEIMRMPIYGYKIFDDRNIDLYL
nr:MAG TPA: hypothetical protein [Caudoviricetes sp.]